MAVPPGANEATSQFSVFGPPVVTEPKAIADGPASGQDTPRRVLLGFVRWDADLARFIDFGPRFDGVIIQMLISSDGSVGVESSYSSFVPNRCSVKNNTITMH